MLTTTKALISNLLPVTDAAAREGATIEIEGLIRWAHGTVNGAVVIMATDYASGEARITVYADREVALSLIDASLADIARVRATYGDPAITPETARASLADMHPLDGRLQTTRRAAGLDPWTGEPVAEVGATLTISGARELAAAGAASATYYRAFEAGVEVDRGHIPASHRSWPVDATIAHLEAGRVVELREGAADGPVALRFTAIAPGVRAAI